MWDKSDILVKVGKYPMNKFLKEKNKVFYKKTFLFCFLYSIVLVYIYYIYKMNRSIYYNYIEDKLFTLSKRVKSRGKLNILDLHIHLENFYLNLLNKLIW